MAWCITEHGILYRSKLESILPRLLMFKRMQHIVETEHCLSMSCLNCLKEVSVAKNIFLLACFFCLHDYIILVRCQKSRQT